MSAAALTVLIILFFITTVVGVVTGSNSLITVPVMFQFGIDEKVAIGTNMFGLTFMAIGATIPFFRAGHIEARRLTPLILVTIAGSALGAALVGLFTGGGIKLMVSAAMIVIVLFTVIRREPAPEPNAPATAPWQMTTLGIFAAFLLAIYGGLYSGGYVTVLTAAFVAFLGMTYGGAIAVTKLINVFSSGIATIVFMWQGLVDYRLGWILAVTMFAGAYVGAHFAARMNDRLLRAIFLATVLILAIKTLYDLF